MNESTIRITQQLGTLLRSYRKFKKIPQKEFAQRVGLCQSRVSYLENHPEAMSFEQLMRTVTDCRPSGNNIVELCQTVPVLRQKHNAVKSE